MEEIYVAILETLAVHESRLSTLEQAHRDERVEQQLAPSQSQQWLILIVTLTTTILAALIGATFPWWLR